MPSYLLCQCGLGTEELLGRVQTIARWVERAWEVALEVCDIVIESLAAASIPRYGGCQGQRRRGNQEREMHLAGSITTRLNDDLEKPTAQLLHSKKPVAGKYCPPGLPSPFLPSCDACLGRVRPAAGDRQLEHAEWGGIDRHLVGSPARRHGCHGVRQARPIGSRRQRWCDRAVADGRVGGRELWEGVGTRQMTDCECWARVRAGDRETIGKGGEQGRGMIDGRSAKIDSRANLHMTLSSMQPSGTRDGPRLFSS